MSKKRGPGRPPLGAEARTEVVTIKLTRAERAALQERVERSGAESVSEWIRAQLI